MKDYSFPVGQDIAFKFGCGRFRMEEHLLERCAEEVLRFGRKPLFVCNDTTFEIAYIQKAVGAFLPGAAVAMLAGRFWKRATWQGALASVGASDALA